MNKFKQTAKFLISLIAALGLTWVLMEPSFSQAQAYVLFLLCFSVGLWLTEVAPPFAVGLFIMAYLAFTLGSELFTTTPQDVKPYLNTFSSSVIWLMMGGFFLASAMTKTRPDADLIRMTMKLCGSDPRRICLILALYALHTLPVNYAGLALILVGVILLLLEIKVTSYGLLTIGGAIALFFGSIMLIDSDSSLEFVRLSWAVIIPAVLGTVAFFLFAVGMGLRAQRGKPVTGNEGMIGLAGEALTDLDPGGEVRVHGEIWRAESGGGPIRRGSRVRVTAVRNLTLTVAPLD